MNNHEEIAHFCESLAGAEATAPFGPQTVVYKVGGKMFALLSLGLPRLNVKCDPEEAIQLRERHESVEYGYHMSKKHWNSIYWDREALPNGLIQTWIENSYKLVVGSLSKKVQAELNG
ncbi:MAG: MmcQ/YjbR family DNA-binding protein [Saprospiraceae bacterium]